MSEENNKSSGSSSVPVDEDQCNKTKILCERCSSVILLPTKAKYIKKGVRLTCKFNCQSLISWLTTCDIINSQKIRHDNI